MASTIQLRRGTAAQWSSANPVLALGELGLVTDTQEFKIGDGVTAWGSLGVANLTPSYDDPWTYVKLGSDFTNSTTTYNAVTGLAFTPAANTDYEINGILLLRSAATTTGPRPGVTWPTNVDDAALEISSPSSGTAMIYAYGNALAAVNAASTGILATTGSYPGLVTGVLRAGASVSGDFQITLASEVGSSQVTMKAGSFIRYRAY